MVANSLRRRSAFLRLRRRYKSFGVGSCGSALNFARQLPKVERNPLRFAILSLIQRALLPRLMVLAPESLAVTLTGSKFVGRVVSSLLKIHRREQIASEPRGNNRARNG